MTDLVFKNKAQSLQNEIQQPKTKVTTLEDKRENHAVSVQRKVLSGASNAGTNSGSSVGCIADNRPGLVAQRNNTGLPDQLKNGVESLSGMSMDHVKVHYNSDKPAQLNAHAYAQGSDIHLAPGQEKHLPHEAWHVVQQAQGRVKPTMQMKAGVSVNDNAGLEGEADVMGAKAMALKSNRSEALQLRNALNLNRNFPPLVQRQTEITYTKDTQFDYYSTPALRAAAGGFDQVSDVGSHTIARLDLNDPKQGSGVGAGNAARSAQAATAVHGTQFVAGHLLNGGLGGLGIDANMVPITQNANSLHSGIEQNVKHLLAQAPVGPVLPPGNGHLLYEVDVTAPGGGFGGANAILDEAAPNCDLNVRLTNLMGLAPVVVANTVIQSRTPPLALPAAWNQLGTGRRSAATGGALVDVAVVAGNLTNPVSGVIMPVAVGVTAGTFNGVTGQLMALIN